MFIKTIISLILSIFLILYCSNVHGAINQHTISMSVEQASIVQLIEQALTYEWWSEEKDYQVDLGKFYESPALEIVTDAIKQYRETDTDWYSLTFIKNCHIVYNNGNIAIVEASVIETDVTKETQTGKGVFTLHKTSEGWRIREMHYDWYTHHNHLLQEVTAL
ncbi:hypothetical protein SPSYN_02435 [Sporotomaculum syntrophicum]|uniref:Uncharacterized protein n=1 Tax=Sporotomaculum syntrophicum TaxID=182264 RepID=A0A9D3AX57_9FIRM|nr:hypothetical protein [Sporotomaculum syntrophicum]KAF1084657.1 hypothetical protein SPSYN_02435 [Sporotomaculum syntrophicum]